MECLECAGTYVEFEICLPCARIFKARVYGSTQRFKLLLTVRFHLLTLFVGVVGCHSRRALEILEFRFECAHTQQVTVHRNMKLAWICLVVGVIFAKQNEETKTESSEDVFRELGDGNYCVVNREKGTCTQCASSKSDAEQVTMDCMKQIYGFEDPNFLYDKDKWEVLSQTQLTPMRCELIVDCPQYDPSLDDYQHFARFITPDSEGVPPHMFEDADSDEPYLSHEKVEL